MRLVLTVQTKCGTMNRPNTPSDPDQAIDVELSAYLDGEIDELARKNVERKLSTHAIYRERLKLLQASWDMLDQLPNAETDESFTRGTVAMATLHVADPNTAKVTASQPWVRGPWLRMGGYIAVAFLFGFTAVSVPTRLAYRHATRNLPLIQHYELYFNTDSLEFLRLLDKEDLFAEELDELL